MMSSPQAAAGSPQYSAIVICNRYTEIKLAELVDALRAVAPSSKIGDWIGPFDGRDIEAFGSDMISIDGVQMTLLSLDQPLPPPFFDIGPVPSQLMPNPLQQLRGQRAHVSIVPAALPQNGPSAVATARAVSLLALAVAIVTQAEAVKWIDSNNFVSVALLRGCAARLAVLGGTAVPFWIRIFAGRAHDQQKIIAGSYGLWSFGLDEIEYAPIAMSIEELVPHAWSVCEYVMSSEKAVKDDDTIDVDQKNVFKLDVIANGFFGTGRNLRLSWLAPSKSFKPS
ncbi:DUF4261 domain-containing protein [Bradyrhizobium sp. HKCCYLS2038]|uniref:DUF4261 domain-containing protein n=1 Tax=unclassified Bradyrhizobium TaxID=2631580 RepID=UPI003EBD372C